MERDPSIMQDDPELKKQRRIDSIKQQLLNEGLSTEQREQMIQELQELENLEEQH